MNKLETVRQFKSASDIELEAMQQAQLLADKTAAEMIAMAEAMTTITNEMRDSQLKAGKAAIAAAQAARESAKQTDASAVTLAQATEQMLSEAQRKRSQTSRFLELFSTVVLSATVACVCQHLPVHF
jgi:hypothetical protein